MTHVSLSTFTLKTVANYRSAAVKGLDAVSAGTERAIVMSANSLSSQVKRIAKLANGVDNRVVARGLQAAARISLPGAKVALTLSERVAAGADKLAQVAAGPRKAKASAATKAKTAAAQRGAKLKAAPKRAVAAKPASRIVAKAVRDTAAEIEVTGQAVKKAAKRRARALEAQVGQAVKPAAKPRAVAKPKAVAKPAPRAVRKAAPAAQAVQDVAAAA